MSLVSRSFILDFFWWQKTSSTTLIGWPRWHHLVLTISVGLLCLDAIWACDHDYCVRMILAFEHYDLFSVFQGPILSIVSSKSSHATTSLTSSIDPRQLFITVSVKVYGISRAHSLWCWRILSLAVKHNVLDPVLYRYSSMTMSWSLFKSLPLLSAIEILAFYLCSTGSFLFLYSRSYSSG